jgi:hypothetical protein
MIQDEGLIPEDGKKWPLGFVEHVIPTSKLQQP